MDKRFMVRVSQPSNNSRKEYTSKEIIIDGKKMIAVVVDTSKEEKLTTLIKAIPTNHIK